MAESLNGVKDNGDDIPYHSWLKVTKIPAQNIVIRLYHRELHITKGSLQHTARKFYENIMPDFTVTNIQKPPCYLRKFTPDGRFLTAFSQNQTALEIYSYLGPTGAAEMLSAVDDKEILQRSAFKATIEKEIFQRFFKLKHIVSVASNREQLNRECSLFSDDGRYIIIGSTTMRSLADLGDTHRNNESVTPNPRSPLDDYCIYIIDIEHGLLIDKRSFLHDKIFLAHNQGLSLFGNTLAVLSVQHQNITILKITDQGRFVDGVNIGKYCYPDDPYFVQSTLQMGDGSRRREYTEGANTIYSLKHRVLVFLYMQAALHSNPRKRAKSILEFYKLYEDFCNLKIWKMQLIDESHILLKYSCEDVVTLRSPEPNAHPSLFFFYNIETTKISAVYENTSTEFEEISEKYSDFFRNARLSIESPFTSCPANCYYARKNQERSRATIVSAKGGGRMEATKRILGQLPVSGQSFTASPYLDLSLFCFDDKWVSGMERPKNCYDHSIRFFGRQSGLYKFSINAQRSFFSNNIPSTVRKLVAFSFHPWDPFAVSVQRANDEYVVNFHIYHKRRLA